jgi:acetate kinase
MCLSLATYVGNDVSSQLQKSDFNSVVIKYMNGASISCIRRGKRRGVRVE